MAMKDVCRTPAWFADRKRFSMRHTLMLLTSLALVLTVPSAQAQQTNIIMPKRNPEVAPPPKINSSGWIDSPYISQDGRALYFMYSRYNFFPQLKKNGPPVATGPYRQNHNANNQNPNFDSDIYISRLLPDGTWKTPVNIIMVNDRGDNCCAMVVEGSPTRMYLQKEYAGFGNNLIYREQGAEGMWGAPILFPAHINTRYNEENIHASSSQQQFYFTSDRPDGYGGKDIWFFYKTNDGKFSFPRNIGPMINSKDEEDHFWIADDPDYKGNHEVYFTRAGSQIWRTVWNATDGFSAPQRLDLGVPIAREASVTADGSKLYFSSRNPETETTRIMVSLRRPDGTWMPGRPID